MEGRYAVSRDRDGSRHVRLQTAVSASSGVNIIVSTGMWLDAPHLRSLGASDDDIRKLTVDNPRRYFEGKNPSVRPEQRYATCALRQAQAERGCAGVSVTAAKMEQI